MVALIKCPRCGKPDSTVLLDNDGEPYLCNECWNEDD
jgi:NMD protein affecting ribosome stability and mRNA decay